MITRPGFQLLFAVLIIVISHCSNNSMDVAGGNTSGVGNGVIMGKILKPDSTGASNTVIRAVPADFDPVIDSAQSVTFPEVIADASGFFILSQVTRGIYTIEANLDSLGTIKDSIAISVNNDTSIVPDALLSGTGTIIGFSYMPGQDYYAQSSQHIYIRGTSFFTCPEFGGRFILEKIPAGGYTLTIRPREPREPHEIDVIVSAGDTVVLDTIYSPLYH